MNKSYSPNPVYPKFISYQRVFRKIEVRVFEVVYASNSGSHYSAGSPNLSLLDNAISTKIL